MSDLGIYLRAFYTSISKLLKGSWVFFTLYQQDKRNIKIIAIHVIKITKFL